MIKVVKTFGEVPVGWWVESNDGQVKQADDFMISPYGWPSSLPVKHGICSNVSDELKYLIRKDGA